MRLESYSKIYNVGHAALVNANFFDRDLLIEEKVDGSQFSFGLSEDGNEVEMRSKRCRLMPDMGGKLFNGAMTTVQDLKDDLRKGFTYRGEVVHAPRHNVLTYGRVPFGNLIIYDIDAGNQLYLNSKDKIATCKDLGLECVPVLLTGKVTPEEVEKLLSIDSILGGTKVEGVVLKPMDYNLFDPYQGRVLMGKLVSTAFREIENIKIKKTASLTDIITSMIDSVATDARFEKSVQVMREDGLLTNSTTDIGSLLKLITTDIREEEMDRLKEEIIKHFNPDRIVREVLKGAARRVPDWYRSYLLKDSE